jgi:hypothetical protein
MSKNNIIVLKNRTPRTDFFLPTILQSEISYTEVYFVHKEIQNQYYIIQYVIGQKKSSPHRSELDYVRENRAPKSKIFSIR